MKTNVEDYVEPMKSKLQDKWQDVQQQVTDKARATHEYVTGNPWKAVAMVAVASCILGWLLRGATSED